MSTICRNQETAGKRFVWEKYQTGTGLYNSWAWEDKHEGQVDSQLGMAAGHIQVGVAVVSTM